MRNSVRQACADMIAPGDHITCAVSGGPDSMAMLWCLYTLRCELQISLSVLHCNHHLRDNAAQDAAFVAAFCAQHGIAYQIFDLDVAARQAATGESLEDAARQLRYACFTQVPGKVAVAHHAEDNLETSLIRLVRGTSPRGLSGIPPRRGNIIRPLLFVHRAQLLAFLAAEQIPYRLDESNEQDFCLRNRLRHHVLPQLTAENPLIAEIWLDTSQQLRQEDAYLSSLAATAMEEIRTEHGFSISKLHALHPVLQRRVLFGYLQEFGVPLPQRRHLLVLQTLVQSDTPSAAADLPGCQLMRRYDEIGPAAGEPTTFAPVPLCLPGRVLIPELGLQIICDYVKNCENFANAPTIFTLNYGMIPDGALTVRPRQPGDTMRLPGGSRSLKKLLIDRKIPRSQRDRIPVIAVGSTVLAVAGIGVNQSYAAGSVPDALQIRIEKET